MEAVPAETVVSAHGFHLHMQATEGSLMPTADAVPPTFIPSPANGGLRPVDQCDS